MSEQQPTPSSATATTVSAVSVVEDSSGPIIAKAGKYYRYKHFLMVAILFGFGLWSLYDGYIHFPKDQEQWKAEHPGADEARIVHPGYDIPFNKTIGIALPPLSLVLLWWTIYRSRGQVKLTGDKLEVPGHPAISLLSIRKIDRSKWDRKGIAVVNYQLPGTTQGGMFRLDDYVYEQEPIDEIFKRIEAAAQGAGPVKPMPAAQATNQPIGKPAALKPIAAPRAPLRPPTGNSISQIKSGPTGRQPPSNAG